MIFKDAIRMKSGENCIKAMKKEGDRRKNQEVGLVRDPFYGPDLKRALNEIQGAVNDVANKSAAGLERGRLADGLETLIENHVRLAAQAQPDTEALDESLDRLLNALVRFAEKVLIIANNNALIDPTQTKDKFSRYVLVLQAVGNSILIQADELRQRKGHKMNLKDKDRTRAELQALKRKFKDLGDETLGEKENAREVLDRLIAALRYEHIEALKNPSQGAGRAKDIEAAIKVAYEQRAGMAYIRPSSAYLRSSYPSTSLQDDPGLAWQNMLASHSRRSFPLIGTLFANPPSEKERRRIVREIDKQFWQNINSVRVAGAGATNYVIAKDDIGNWYVKSFSADPESIIKSAQQLALFNLGGQMGTNLIRQRDLQRKADSGKASTEDKAELEELRQQNRRGGNATLDRLFEKHKKDYRDRTEQDYNGLIEAMKVATIQGRILKAWSENDDTKDTEFLDKFKNELTSAEKNLGPALKELQDLKKTEQRGIKIIDALDAIRQFHNSLKQGILGLDLPDPPMKTFTKAMEELQDVRMTAAKEPPITDAERKDIEKAEGEAEAAEKELRRHERAESVALREVTDIVRGELAKIEVRRQEAVKTYETSVIFIGGAASPAPQPKSEAATEIGAPPQTTTPSEPAAPGGAVY